MYDKYMVLREDIQSVIENGVGTGFEVKLRIPYYRGVFLSLVEDVTVTFNSTVFTRDQLKFSVGGDTYTFDEMATMSTLRWEYGEKATVFVPLKGGIPLGLHRIEVSVTIRVSYMGGGRPFTVVLENVSPMGG
ncbi:hypothetical protein DFR58_11239 [Anaerobacterium chartisolvens]|uniref:C-deglycosylation enzyme beta subunit n=1 Tax=Anaerobacterium chartisolvens TaxID=1297424 RepID=A0A369B611_9FIRM|nr:DUF6379 domain-containing protein [Anaerobacterium chartisolvens]RCX16058.1 hypothetical protein DFR58_11239 [Anaerobacterium chartisolvens]